MTPVEAPLVVGVVKERTWKSPEHPDSAIHVGITLTFLAGIVAYALAAGALAVVLRTGERLHAER